MGLAFDGASFLIFYVPLLLGSLLCYWLLVRKGRVGIFHSAGGRAAIAIIFTLIALAVIAVAFRGSVTTIASSAGVYVSASTANTVGSAVGATTQELQKPSFSFLFASFALGFYLLPIGVILSLLMLTGVSAHSEGKKRFRRSALAILVAGLILLAAMYAWSGFDRTVGFAISVIFLLVLLATYFLYKEGEEGRLKVGKVAFAVLFAYLAVTAYLQYNAIRYNSLLSVPIAIFAAYGLYCMIEISKRARVNGPALKYLLALCVVVAIAAIAFFWLRNIITLEASCTTTST